MDSPVFVIGCPRSGTTLVYSILLSSGVFPVYEAESRVLECSSRYGSLRRPSNVDAFLTDFLDSRQFSRSGLDPDWFREEMVARCTSYSEVLDVFMGAIADGQGKSRWAEKTPNHVFYIGRIASAFPDARFVHVVRDGRDVALSQRKLGWLRRYTRDPLLQLIWGGKMWEQIVRAARRQGERLPGRYREVRYEDMVRDLDEVLPGLESFTGVELSVGGVAESRFGALGRANTAFRDSNGHGVFRQASGRWRERLEVEERRSLDWAIGETLATFGYETPRPISAGEISGWVRIHARLAPFMLGTKRWLNRHTPLGRFSRKPLEIGLE
jgi:hypothetical protein